MNYHMSQSDIFKYLKNSFHEITILFLTVFRKFLYETSYAHNLSYKTPNEVISTLTHH